MLSGLKCTDPQERKQRLSPKKKGGREATSATNQRNSFLSDEPQIKEVMKSSPSSDIPVINNSCMSPVPNYFSSLLVGITLIYSIGKGV